jgi:hypothetical protein
VEQLFSGFWNPAAVQDMRGVAVFWRSNRQSMARLQARQNFYFLHRVYTVSKFQLIYGDMVDGPSSCAGHVTPSTTDDHAVEPGSCAGNVTPGTTADHAVEPGSCAGHVTPDTTADHAVEPVPNSCAGHATRRVQQLISK